MVSLSGFIGQWTSTSPVAKRTGVLPWLWERHPYAQSRKGRQRSSAEWHPISGSVKVRERQANNFQSDAPGIVELLPISHTSVRLEWWKTTWVSSFSSLFHHKWVVHPTKNKKLGRLWWEHAPTDTSRHPQQRRFWEVLLANRSDPWPPLTVILL